MSVIYRDGNQILIRRRATSNLLRAIPPQVTHFDAQLYAVVPRRPDRLHDHHEYGSDVRLDPCVLNWETKHITMRIPLDINPGVEGPEDLDPDFFEAVQAAFLALATACAS